MAWQYDWTNTYHAHYYFESNAPLALGVMQQAGWTYNAGIAVIGNLEQESGINPGQWQGGYNIGDWDNNSCGFGLAQWTPGRKYAIYIGYPTGSPPVSEAADGERQMQFLINTPSQWSTGLVDMNTGYSSYYGITVPILPNMAAFAASNASIEDRFLPIVERRVSGGYLYQWRVVSGEPCCSDLYLQSPMAYCTSAIGGTCS